MAIGDFAQPFVYFLVCDVAHLEYGGYYFRCRLTNKLVLLVLEVFPRELEHFLD